MVKWTVNGVTISIRADGNRYVVESAGASSGTPTLIAALGRVKELLHRALAGAHGLTGWALVVEFPQIRAAYGDARRPGGPSVGPTPDVVRCANSIYTPEAGPHPAVENSVDIVRSCWDALAMV